MKADYEAEGRTVLLLDAGDAFQGSSLINESKGSLAPTVMNAAGYDAMAIGNHEFDYGSDVLQELIQECDFPVLSADVTVDATGELFAAPNTVFTLPGGTKVGVFGLTTPETLTKSAPKNTVGLSFAQGRRLYAVAQKQVNELRDQGCDLVICLGHLGENDVTEPSRACDVVAHVSGLDILIDGHDHKVENQALEDKAGNLVPVFETGSGFANVGVITYADGSWQGELLAADAYSGEDADLAETVAAAVAQLDQKFSEVIGSTPFELDGSRFPGNRDRETNLGDFTADALLWQATQAIDDPVDAAIMNGGGIRATIPAGDITLRNVFDVMPYGNQVDTIEVTGAQLLEALEAATQGLPEPMGGFPQVAGITYTVDLTVPYEPGEQYPDSTYFAPANPGARVTIEDVNGKGFDLDASYVLAVSDFISSGGDTYCCFIGASSESVRSIGYLDYEALVNYLQEECGGIVPDRYREPQGRITFIQ